MRSLLRRIPLFALGIAFVSAEPPGIDQSLEFVTPPTGAMFIRWHGKPGRSYFVQVSDPANHLNTWHFATIIEAGNDHDISYQVDGTADKGFLRLKYTDQVPGLGETLDTADFDGDGISNWYEINIYHTDPLNPDTDGDGIPDGWEIAHGLNPNNSSDAATIFPGSNLTNLQAFNAGVQANPNATPTDKDGDGVANDDDADPNDTVINWRHTSEPRFLVVDLPVGDLDGLTFDDLSDSGTVLFTKRVANSPDTRILIDKNLSFHSLSCYPPDLTSPIGYFGACAPNLIGDQVLGTRLGDNGDQDCTWDPITQTFNPFTVDWYIDDIRDSRADFQVERSYDPLTFDDVLRTPQGYLPDSEDSGWGDARIEKNGNIVAEHGYWRYSADSPYYGSNNSLPETSVARSATLVQYEVNPETGLPTLAHTWNLVAGSTRLLVSGNNGEFVKSSLACGGSHRPIGVTSQGWVASASEIWSNGTWKSLKDLLGETAPQQATLLGILDTGLGVARIQYETGPAKILLLVPIEFRKMWETENKANQIVAKVRRDDPVSSTENPDAEDNLFGTPRNMLYISADPADGKYHVSIDIASAMRAHMLCAAYNYNGKIIGTDTSFSSANDQPANMVIPSTGSSQSGQAILIRMAFDANNSGLIDNSETPITLKVLTSADGTSYPPVVRGFSPVAVADADTAIHGQAFGTGWTGWKPNWAGGFFVPNAIALEKLFYTGDIGQLDAPYVPTASLPDESLNALGPPGDFSEWLTHAAGLQFNADGVATIKHYQWAAGTRISDLISASSPFSTLRSKGCIISQMQNATNAAVEDYKQAGVTVGQSQIFPPNATGYDLQSVLAMLGKPHWSPSWVPKQTLLIGDEDGEAGIIPDDAFGTVGRSRFTNGKYWYVVKKEERIGYVYIPFSPPQEYSYTVVVVYLRVSGTSQDLYDFNHNVGGLSVPAAITQLSFGNGSYGRTHGIIYRTSVNILRDYEMQETRVP